MASRFEAIWFWFDPRGEVHTRPNRAYVVDGTPTIDQYGRCR